MLSFESDYTTGGHEQILRRLLETNLDPQPGYGSDSYCESARQKIRQACACPEADIFFLTGGTQTNALVISALLQQHEGVLAAETGHISTHEAGAIEASGHKVLTLPQHSGKVDAADVEQFCTRFYQDETCSHMVPPGMVYISHPTEYGTLYSKAELEALSRVCKKFELPLFMDGARLGYGLAGMGADVTLPDIAALCDVFYIGGTKVGALCGEAVVFTRGNMPKHFLTLVKRRGALLAKGRLLGVQFDTLFTDGLYEQLGRHAIAMAKRLIEIFRSREYRFYLESPTNQQFIILENTIMERLREYVRFSFWEALDSSHTVVRFAVSWSTTSQDLDQLEAILDA